jgi:hypothetical protein
VPIPVRVTRTDGALTLGSYVLGRLYWSTNATWEPSVDQVLWDSGTTTFLNTALNANGFVDASPTPTVNIPTVNPGNYYILAVVDPTNFHPESNEGNNVTAYPVSITGSAQELVTDGSFSSGSMYWSIISNFWAGTTLSNYRTAPGYAAGGVDSSGAPINNAFGYMYQSLVIPSGVQSVTGRVWCNITTNEQQGSQAFDVMAVWLDDGAGQSHYLLGVSNQDAWTQPQGNVPGSTNYVERVFDLTAYRGQTVRLRFLATTDQSLTTTFRIDDVSVTAQ